VSTAYVEPTYSHPCSNSSESTWVGIGGDSASDPLGQDGTGDGYGDLEEHEAWFEIVPVGPVFAGQESEAEAFSSPLVTAAGHVVVARTDFSGHSYRFVVADVTTGMWSPVQVETYNAAIPVDEYFSGDSAEAIAERPGHWVNGNLQLLNLSDFGSIKFSQFSVNGGPIADYPFGTKDYVLDSPNGVLMAGPVPTPPTELLQLRSGRFIDYYEHCS